MIYLYSGTPGSGKSYHAVLDIYHRLTKKKGFKRVIANFGFSLNDGKTMKDSGFFYMDNSDITPSALIKFARQFHKIGLEGQTLIVLDEAQILFNSRSWQSDNGLRMEWIKFFSQHRKLGFNIIMIAQFDRMIDRQIRCLVEYEVAHMKVNNYFRIIPVTVFLAVTRWYGQKMKLYHETMLYRKKIGNMYDTFMMFGTEPVSAPEVGVPERRGLDSGSRHKVRRPIIYTKRGGGVYTRPIIINRGNNSLCIAEV